MIPIRKKMSRLHSEEHGRDIRSRLRTQRCPEDHRSVSVLRASSYPSTASQARCFSSLFPKRRSLYQSPERGRVFHRTFLTGSLAMFQSGLLLARNSFQSKLPLCVILNANLRTCDSKMILLLGEYMRIVQVVRALSTRLCVFFYTCMFVITWTAASLR